MADGSSFAMHEGERVAAEHGFTALPVDPFAIAERVNIMVTEKPASAGVSGMLMRVRNSFAIGYAAHVPSEGFQRFSVAHELGHYFLPGHPEAVFAAGDVHHSHAGFVSKDPHEREADRFAAGLLMPTAPFRAALDSAGDGLEAVEGLASTCRASLTATAIRYAELTDAQLAVVVSTQDEINYCCMSSSFKELPGLEWLRRKDVVPRDTTTCRFNGDPRRILDAERDEDTVPLDAWFGGGPQLTLLEQVVGLGRYGRTLTVLTVEGAYDAEEVEEDKELVDGWTPRFSRSRKR